MSYTSDVALVIRKKVYEDALKEASENRQERKYWMLINSDGSTAIDKLKVNDDYAVMYWAWVVWDKTLEEVKFIEDMRINDDSYFIRVGENYEDIEIKHNGEDDEMYLVIDLLRNIQISI